MGLDNLVNDENDSSKETSSQRQYVDISQKEFEKFLDEEVPYFWKTVDTGAGEIVYQTDEFMLMYPNVTLRIFSTIEKGGGFSREKGDDAIRLVIWSKKVNRPIGGRKKTLRIKTWKKNLRNKITSLSEEWQEYVRECPECEDGWLVEREGEYGKFLGCINWSDDQSGCKYTEEIN